RGQLYNALFRADGGKMTRLSPDRLITPEALAAELAEYFAPVYFCGDGSHIAVELGLPNAAFMPPLLMSNSAYSVARVALEEYTAAPNADYSDATLAPVYLRASQAEREIKK
ncbi:MAG: tRNA (adenosine(37)-N6)-threonylcarbamoyltransferase complex dimerization subunit type 1 TsaB, partial [Oscillospiraceae bacterium]|nr:tRNA (adenosine(37)-N6)-threonylcarbamoyltransferase complex dimerization subunit type 1 TsaB [Oscillospiraceae bacterium]